MRAQEAQALLTINTCLQYARRHGTNNAKVPGQPVFDHVRPGPANPSDAVREIAAWARFASVQFELQLRLQPGYSPDTVIFKGSLWQQTIRPDGEISPEEMIAQSRGPDLMGIPVGKLENGLTFYSLCHEKSFEEVLRLAAAKTRSFLELVRTFNELVLNSESK